MMVVIFRIVITRWGPTRGDEMTRTSTGAGGRHFLQIPGPTNVPDRVLRAMAAPTIDHAGPSSPRWRSTCCRP